MGQQIKVTTSTKKEIVSGNKETHLSLRVSIRKKERKKERVRYGNI